jgi:rubrerythrin
MHDVQERTGGESESAMERLSRDPSSRKRFLKMVGGAGAAGAFSVVLAACGSDDKKDTTSSGAVSSGAQGGSSAGDLKIVNYALTLEYLEAAFYKEVIASGQIKDGPTVELAKKFGQTEQEHVAVLTAVVKKLGGTPATMPKTNFQPVIDGGAKKILSTAASVENLGAAAYLGQAGSIKSAEILAAALSIHSVEARHASTLNTALGKTATPDGAFAKPADMATVLKAVQPFIAS